MSTAEQLLPPAAVGLDGTLQAGYSSLELEEAPKPAYQSRVQTIASIVNTMMGTTILALPFGMLQSGIASGLLITGVLGFLSCVTCLIVVERGLLAGHRDFNGSVEAYLGRHAMLVAWAFSVAIILGAAIVYHILMQETLYALVKTALSVAGSSSSSGSSWSPVYAAIVPFVLYPICCLKDLSFIRRFNSLGFVFMWFTIIFISYHGLHALAAAGSPGASAIAAQATAAAGASPYAPSGAFQVVTLGTPMFAGLGGMMMLSFFLHNVVQPLIENADPATRKVDICIAYVLAGLLYSCVGILGYIGFADAHTSGAAAACSAAFPPPLPGSHLAAGAKPAWLASSNCTLSSDFLANFGADFASPPNVYAFTVRISLLLQLFTVFPILLLIIRNQVFRLALGVEYPSLPWVAGLNAAVMAATFAFAALDLQIGAVLSYVGAVGGFVIVFAVPVAMEAVALVREAEGGGAGEQHTDGLLEEEGEGSSSSSKGSGRVTCSSLGRLRALDKLKLGGILAVGAFFFLAQFIAV